MVEQLFMDIGMYEHGGNNFARRLHVIGLVAG
jgi:hypothetical protein